MDCNSSYELVDSGHFRKLEKVGPYILIRPSAQAVWAPRLSKQHWSKADAEFKRYKNGDGKWHFKGAKLPSQWAVNLGNLTYEIKLTDFGHLGVFPEHHNNQLLKQAIFKKKQSGKPFRLLNLFAYTGAVTLFGASHGAEVVHVDASKTSVAWARQNAQLSGLEQSPIRWIVEDAKKFVARELRRSQVYDGIVLDPPSFGRGTKNEVWKIEDDLLKLLEDLKGLQSDDFSFMQLSSHSLGFTPIVLKNVLNQFTPEGYSMCFEMCISEKESQRQLPSGCAAVFLSDRAKAE